jgi:peptidyl-tRNA hydrolase
MKVYVLVRKDLKLSHSAVQGGHALVELTQLFDIQDWSKNHRTLVYLEVKSERELLDYYRSCPMKEKAIFQEPDLSDQFTAMASLAKTKEDERFFKKLQLL